MIFQRGEYTKPMGLDGWCFQRGEYTKPNGFWWVMFSKGGVHKTDGLWLWCFKGGSTQNRWVLMGFGMFSYCFQKLSARGVYFGKYGQSHLPHKSAPVCSKVMTCRDFFSGWILVSSGPGFYLRPQTGHSREIRRNSLREFRPQRG